MKGVLITLLLIVILAAIIYLIIRSNKPNQKTSSMPMDSTEIIVRNISQEQIIKSEEQKIGRGGIGTIN